MEQKRVGIVLAGGKGTRLYPLTRAISKQLLPVYDKPLIYYALDTLKQMGIKDILLICMLDQLSLYQKALGDGSQFRLNIQYKIQPKPNGLAEAFLLGENFINGRSVALILGDNIFVTGKTFKEKTLSVKNMVFGYKVNDPRQYGVLEFDENHRLINVVEKPQNPPSDYVCTGLYLFDSTVVEKAKNVRPSKRGELEIVDVINQYIAEDNCDCCMLEDGEAWFDCGNVDDLLECANYIKALQRRANTKIGL